MAEKPNQIKVRLSEKKKNLKSTAAKRRQGTNAVTTNRLKVLITVVNRNKTEYYADIIQSFDVNMQAIALANGTADAKTLRYLGLTDTNKSVILSIIQENKSPEALRTLEEKFNTVKGGKGIAFTLPLTSVIGKLLFGFLSNNKEFVKENN